MACRFRVVRIDYKYEFLWGALFASVFVTHSTCPRPGGPRKFGVANGSVRVAAKSSANCAPLWMASIGRLRDSNCTRAHSSPKYARQDRAPPTDDGTGRTVKLDSRDIRLIMALINGGRRTNREIADRIGLSESACHTRLQSLERTGYIHGYKAVIAFERIGFFHAWADVTLTNDSSSAIAEFAQIACAAPEVIEAHLMDGPCHFRLEAVAENLEAWQAFAKRLLARADLVSRVERRAIFRACNAQSF